MALTRRISAAEENSIKRSDEGDFVGVLAKNFRRLNRASADPRRV